MSDNAYCRADVWTPLPRRPRPGLGNDHPMLRPSQAKEGCMKTIAITTAILATSLLCQPVGNAGDAKMGVQPDSVSLFEVPLRCPAAPHIGCGSLAKPILLALEGDAEISEAWIDSAGTTLAVVGTENSGSESRARAVVGLLESVFGKSSATELRADARDRALTSFLSGSGWYRGAQVDSLSKQEAGIIAARLVRRVQASVTLSAETAKALETALTEAIERRLVGDPGQPAPADRGSHHEDLLKLAREHLDEKGVAAFRQSIAKGYRPGQNER